MTWDTICEAVIIFAAFLLGLALGRHSVSPRASVPAVPTRGRGKPA